MARSGAVGMSADNGASPAPVLTMLSVLGLRAESRMIHSSKEWNYFEYTYHIW